jgi:hypothetical protein
MRKRAACCVALFVLAACDPAQVSLPTPVRGVWGNDCNKPVVEFTETGIHVYADNATYALESVTFNGNDLNVTYTSARGAVSETYFKSGETLRLDHGTVAGAAVTGSTHAMNRCN